MVTTVISSQHQRNLIILIDSQYLSSSWLVNTESKNNTLYQGLLYTRAWVVWNMDWFQYISIVAVSGQVMAKNTCNQGRKTSESQLYCVLALVDGWDNLVGIVMLDGSGFEPQWGVRFSVPIQTGPKAHPASFTVGNRILSPGIKQQLYSIENPLPYSTEVVYWWNYTCVTPLCAAMACYEENLPFYW